MGGAEGEGEPGAAAAFEVAAAGAEADTGLRDGLETEEDVSAVTEVFPPG